MIRPAGEERKTRAGKRSERGSALLIVFVFAAIIAIMLYMELPVAVFEAQRQKEELLIDHGNEYAHAVKLFVRKIGTYPASIEALEKTNQMRFLRHRFKDPLTGKDDWRLLHAGPNGTLIDSKVKLPGFGQNTNGANGANAANGSTGNSAFPNGGSSTSGSAFGNGLNSGSSSSFGSSSANANSAPPEVVVPPLTQRAPAVAANGSGQTAGAAGSDQNPLTPLLPAGQAEASLGGQQASAVNGSTPGQAAAAGQDAAGTGGQNGAAPGAGGNANGASPQAGTGSPATSTSSSRSGSTLGTISSGGIAGVASKAGGHSIKTVNDQTDYSLWEFYYDPTKDATRGIAGAAGSLGAAQQANQQQNGLGQSQPQNGFGTSSPFGTSNSSGTTTNNPFAGASGFSGNSSQGTNSTNPAPTVPPTQPPPQ